MTAHTLRDYQKEGVQFLVNRKRALLADDMGTGKTIQALMAAEAAKSFPCIVVCPASMKLIWQRTIADWLPHRTTHVVKSTKDPMQRADFVVVNYDLIVRRKDELLSLNHVAIVFDEAHYLKNPKAQRSQAGLSLAWKCWTRYLLSGTPMTNRPIELVHLLKVLGRLSEFGGFEGFANRYCDPQRVWTGSRYVNDYRGSSNEEELGRRLRDICMLRRMKRDILKELPPMQHITLPVDIANRMDYRRVEKDLRVWLLEQAHNTPDLDDEERSRKAVAALAMEGNAEVLVRIEYLKQVAARGKVPAILEWIHEFLEDTDDKVVVFAHHADVRRAIIEEFAEVCVKVEGGDSATHRQAAVDAFQTDPKVRVFMGSIQAAGVGLTLTAASRCLIVELPWTPAEVAQAHDRIHRIGQKADSVEVYYMLGRETIDEAIWELLDEKRKVITNVMEV